MSSDFAGLYPAFLTPLDDNRKLNVLMAEKMLAHLLSSGFAGTYIAGSTGEGMRQTVEERKQLLEALSQVMPAGKRMLVHVGTGEIGTTVVLAEHAAALGADAISSLPPQGDARKVNAFYAELAQKSPLPLILYYFPKIAPQAFADTQELIDICEMPNVIGVKFTDFNFYLMQRLLKRGNIVFNGYDEALAAGLLMGAMGGIGSTYNVLGPLYQKIFKAANDGDWETARRWQTKSNGVLDVMLRYPFFPALREMMRELGFDCGPMMSGETLASEQQRKQLLGELDREIPADVAELIGWSVGARD